MAQDFWRNSGFHLLARNGAARLQVTEDFLRAYLLRPELQPAEESGAGETALYERLIDDPRRPVADDELAAVEDADARGNFRIWLEFRARLLGAGSVEGCYRGLFDAEMRTPPLFIDQLAQIILRGLLEGVDDPLEVRAAELFFREQKASIDDGQIMLADLETVEMHASGGAYGSLGRLIVEAQDTDQGSEPRRPRYRERRALLAARSASRSRDQPNYGRAALAALGRVIERWVRHFCAVEVKVMPLRRIEEKRWAWHIGLDAQSTALLNDLWRGEEVEAGRLARLLALFRMEFADAGVMRPDVAGQPVYLALAMDEDERGPHEAAESPSQPAACRAVVTADPATPEYWDARKARACTPRPSDRPDHAGRTARLHA